MREYKKEETKASEHIICNGCGKVIAVKHGMPMEGVLRVRQVWEYMSGKDGQVDSFDLCSPKAPLTGIPFRYFAHGLLT